MPFADLTALTSGVQLGLPVTSNSVISGDEMDRWNDHLLEEMIDNITIFYRMAPKHKVKIIKVSLATSHWRATVHRQYMWQRWVLGWAVCFCKE